MYRTARAPLVSRVYRQKGSTNPETMQQAIIQTVQRIDQDQPLPDIKTLKSNHKY